MEWWSPALAMRPESEVERILQKEIPRRNRAVKVAAATPPYDPRAHPEGPGRWQLGSDGKGPTFRWRWMGVNRVHGGGAAGGRRGGGRGGPPGWADELGRSPSRGGAHSDRASTTMVEWMRQLAKAE